MMDYVDVASDREVQSGKNTRSNAKTAPEQSVLHHAGADLFPLEGEANKSVCPHLLRVSCDSFGTVVREHLCTLAPPLAVVVHNFVFCVMALKFVS